ncbi:unnamed protein product [Ectocarpus sp. 6 AP-2014]
MTNAWTRLVVAFGGDVSSDVDVSEIYATLRLVYDIGYIGLYVWRDHKYLFLQTKDWRVQMTPNKVRKICCRFGNIGKVENFSRLEGTCVEQIGTFRKTGRKAAPKGTATTNIDNSTNITNNITNNNTTTIDNSVTNNTVHLHVHAFGQEDVSNISLQAFQELIGEKDHILKNIRNELPEVCTYITSREWERVYHRLYEKQEKAKALASPPDMASDSEDDCTVGESGVYIPKSLMIRGQEATYERINGDDELKKELKRLIEEMTLLQEDAKYRCLEAPRGVANLMYDNPHNCNIIASTKDGTMKYYDGKSWQKVRIDNMAFVFDNWEKKFRETVEMLTEREGIAMTESFQGHFCQELMSKWDEPVRVEPKTWRRMMADQKRQALLALDNMNRRFKEVKKTTGKKVERGSENDRDVKRRKYMKEATWTKLAAL